MMISEQAVRKILGIEDKVDLKLEDMAKRLTFTVFPFDAKKISRNSLIFLDLLQASLLELGIKILPYNDTLEKTPLTKIAKRFLKINVNNFLYLILQVLRVEHAYYFIHPGAILNLAKRERIRKGTTIIAVGENETSKLPIDYTSSFTRNTVITILDCPSEINEQTDFAKHFDTAMDAFSYHMTQIAIFVDQNKWVVYNFNASHPIYPLHSDFTENVLEAIIPKVAAPIHPPLLKDFIIEPETFNIDTEPYSSLINDFIDGGALFNETKLYPRGKKVDSLPFRSGFYKWIGRIHLDHRSGMSYGFLARQLPSEPEPLIPLSKFPVSANDLLDGRDFFVYLGHLYIVLEIESKKYCLKVPPVWVLTQRSGSDKTRINIREDFLLLGLVDGKMYLRTAKGTKLRRDYRPSFDTKVILAHAIGNSIISSLLEFTSDSTNKSSEFVKHMKTDGLAIIHWHGYIQRKLIPPGWSVHGYLNPHVACSTAQSAIYALSGKLNVFNETLTSGEVYKGDVHIEPHHGTNITFVSIIDLARFLLSAKRVSELGNRYLGDY